MALAVWTYPITASAGGISAIKAYRRCDFRRMIKWTLCTYSSVGFFLLFMASGILVETMSVLSD